MALKSRIKGLMLDTEANYGDGVIADLAPGDDSILTRNLTPEPIRSNAVDYERDRNALGANSQIIINNSIAFTTDVYVSGNGANGAIASLPYEKLLLICGFGATNEAAPVAWAVGEDYVVGDLVENGGDYYSCIQDNTSAVANGPAGLNTAQYWKEYFLAKIYKPKSTAFDSGVFAIHTDGVRFVGNGARGNMTGEFTAGELPFLSFDVQGLPINRADNAQPAYDVTAFKLPVGVTRDNVPTCELFDFKAVVRTWSFDLGNVIFFQDEPNSKAILLNNRAISGSISLEMEKIATKDYFTIAEQGDLGEFKFVHGEGEGNEIEFFAPSVRLGPPVLSTDNDRFMLDVPLTFLPSTSGNDELEIRAR